MNITDKLIAFLIFATVVQMNVMGLSSGSGSFPCHNDIQGKRMISSLFPSHGELLPMLSEFSSRAVYHVKTSQLNDFSCGYNVLFNAANFAHYCGFSNTVHDYSVFRQKVLSYINPRRLDPLKDTFITTLDDLARNIPQLQPIYQLYRIGPDATITPLIPEITTVTNTIGTRQTLTINLTEKALEARVVQEIENIKTILKQPTSAMVHFSCYVKSSGVAHVILISLLQNDTGRGLYIFDNTNKPITQGADICRYIEYLSRTFDVSSSQTFTGPLVPPRLWPSVQRGSLYDLLAGISMGLLAGLEFKRVAPPAGCECHLSEETLKEQKKAYMNYKNNLELCRILYVPTLLAGLALYTINPEVGLKWGLGFVIGVLGYKLFMDKPLYSDHHHE